MKDKIRKLLALAADPSAAPQEAETAARQRAMDEAYGPEARGKSSGVKSSADGYNAGLSAAIPSGRPVSQSYLRLN